MEDKQTIPLPAEPSAAGRKRTIAIAGGAVAAVAIGVVSVVAVTGGSSKSGKSAQPVVGPAAATTSTAPYATDSDGGYSQQQQFTYSARPGVPAPSTATTT